MKNISEAENNYLSNQYNINPKKNQRAEESRRSGENTKKPSVAQKDRGGEQKQEEKVLSTDESTTLHMLFGSSKPEKMQFYTKNKIDQISKGHLLDLEG